MMGKQLIIAVCVWLELYEAKLFVHRNRAVKKINVEQNSQDLTIRTKPLSTAGGVNVLVEKKEEDVTPCSFGVKTNNML